MDLESSLIDSKQPPIFYRYLGVSPPERRKRIGIAVGIAIIVVVVILILAFTIHRKNNPQAPSDVILPTNALERARALQEMYPLIDGHNDLPWAFRRLVKNNITALPIDVFQKSLETDIPRLKQGLVGGQFWSVYVDCPRQYHDAVRATMEQIDVVYRMVKMYPQNFQLARTADEVAAAFQAGKVASLMGMEGGHSIDSSLAALRMFYTLGVRYMTLTHSCNTPWAQSASGSLVGEDGLTSYGEAVVAEMNRLGMLVDLSHVAANVMHTAIRISKAPIIFSHSSAYALCPNERNVPDDVLTLLPANGGVVMVNFFDRYINCTNPDNATLGQVADHIDHIKKVAGIDHVGLGSDFDGVGGRLPQGLTDVSMYPDLIAELITRGYSDEDVQKVMGANILRAMRQTEKVAASLQNDPPSPLLIDYNFTGIDDCRLPFS